MNDEQFFESVKSQVSQNAENEALSNAAKNWHDESRKARYQYLFTWLGRPIIQDPQDVLTVQDLLWKCQPDLVIEAGIARGGSLMLSASMMALFDHFEGAKNKRKVIGIDIDIRAHNREKIKAHPLADTIELIQGSSIDKETIEAVHKRASQFEKVVVFLDSYHTCDHVYQELLAYAPLVSVGSYCLVFDTGIEDVPVNDLGDREWGPGNSPRTAVDLFLKYQTENHVPYKFAIDEFFPNRNVITSARGGFLKRVE